MTKRTGKDEDYKRHRSISKKVCELTRRDHCEHLEVIMQNLHEDQRPFWRWLKKSRQTLPGIQSLVYHNRVVTSTIEKVKVLNQYFSSTFTKENLNKLHEEISVNKPIEQTLDEIYVSEEARI